jgi:hypothetical protein
MEDRLFLVHTRSTLSWVGGESLDVYGWLPKRI